MQMRIDADLLNELKNNELKVYLTMKLMIPAGPGGMELTYEEIACYGGIGTKSVQTSIHSLIDKGYIRKEWPGGPIPPTYYIIK